MIVALIFILLVVGMVVYFNIKNKYQESHQKKCDFCGKEFPDSTKLLDGYICADCQKAVYGSETIDLYSYLLNFKKERSQFLN